MVGLSFLVSFSRNFTFYSSLLKDKYFLLFIKKKNGQRPSIIKVISSGGIEY